MPSTNRNDDDETSTHHGDTKAVKAGRNFTLENDDDSKLLKMHNEWKRVRSNMVTNLDSEKIKTVALIALVAFILVRLGNSTGAPPPPKPMVHGKVLRRPAAGFDLDHDYEDPTLVRRPIRGIDSFSSEDTEAARTNILLMAGSRLENNVLAGSLQQQSQATQRSFLHAQHQRILQEEHQRQQQAMLLAQQQQQALLHARAQRQLEEQLAIQQQTFLEQQKTLLRKQQQEQQEAILLQQQQLRGQDTLLLQKLLQKRSQESQLSDLTTPQLGVSDASPIPLSDSSVGNSKLLSAETNEVDQKTQSTPSEDEASTQSGKDSSSTTQSTPSEEEASSQSGNDSSSKVHFTNSSSPIDDATSTPQNSEQSLETDVPVDVSEKPIPGLTYFRDSWHPYNTKDIPMYFHIPKAGGSTIKDVIGSCLRMVVASEFGVTDGHDKDTEIAIVYPKVPGGTGTEDRSPFVNVDVSTVAGIQRASRMKFADSGLAGLVVSPFLYEANELFTESAQGRLFAVFRHPVDRAVSMFYYIQVASWEPSYMPELKNWTLEQYAKSGVIENNWITRQLSNVTAGDLNDSHLKAAMDVIRRKFLVGIMSKIEESTTRFEKFFQWKYHVNPTNQEACRERLLGKGSNSNEKNKKEKPKPGEPLWELLAAQNLYDIQLYQYVETLFVEQEAFVTGIPDDFRKIDATCCKCDPPTYPLEGFSCPKKVLN